MGVPCERILRNRVRQDGTLGDVGYISGPADEGVSSKNSNKLALLFIHRYLIYISTFEDLYIRPYIEYSK